MMRVLINAASANMGGAVTYLRNVLHWLPRVAPDDRFIVYVPGKTREKLVQAGLADGPQVQLEPYPHADTGGARRLYFDQVEMRALLRKHQADVLFSSTGFGTFVSPCPQVLLVRNLAYFDQAFHARYRTLGRSLRKNTIRRWHSLLSIKRAEVVLFPTQAMQGAVAAYGTLNGRRTEVIHYGFDHEAFSAQRRDASTVAHEMHRWKDEGYHILLNVSTFAVQKNYETLIAALPHLADKGLKVKLFTTLARENTTDKAEYDALMNRATDLGVREDILELGYVPYQQLGTLYQAADLYVFPSFSESFGHSMVEAMASGLPVVAAGTAVNREVCEEAGAYFQTFDPVDCANTIGHVLRNREARARLAETSMARAQHFSWRRYAEQLTDVFHHALQTR